MIRHLKLVVATCAAIVGLGFGFVTLNKWHSEQTARNAEEARYARYNKQVAKDIQPVPELPPLPPAISPQEKTQIIAAAKLLPPEGTMGEYTWPQVDRILSAVRSEREQRPQATTDLIAWYNHLDDPYFTLATDFEDHLVKLKTWCESVPDSPTPLIILGRAHIQHAWHARGGGFADTVSEEGGQLFQQRLGEAKKALDRAEELGLHDGEAIAAQIDAAKGLGAPKSEVLELLEKGMQLDPTYRRMYMAIAEYLLPRWHGEPGEMERLANDVAAKLGGAEGLDAFAQMAFIVNHYDPHTLFDGEYDRRLLPKAADVLVRRYAYDPNRVAFAALCAYSAQDHAKTRWVEAFLYPDEEVTRVLGWNRRSADIRNWCAARSVPNDETSFVWAGDGAYGNISFDSDPRYLWTGNPGSLHTVKLVDVRSGRRELALGGAPYGSINALAFSGDKNWIAAIIMARDFNGWVLWNRKSPNDPLINPVEPQKSIEEQLQTMAMNPIEEQLAIGFIHRVDLFDLKTRKVTNQIHIGTPEKRDYVHHLKYSPNGKRLAVNSTVYDCESGQAIVDLSATLKQKPVRLLVHHLIGFDAENRALAVATEPKLKPANPLVRFSDDGRWETVIADLGKHGHTTALSPNGQLLAIADAISNNRPEGITIWDLQKGTKLKRLGGHWRNIGHMTFSPDNKMLASIEMMGGVIKLWSVVTTNKEDSSPGTNEL